MFDTRGKKEIKSWFFYINYRIKLHQPIRFYTFFDSNKTKGWPGDWHECTSESLPVSQQSWPWTAAADALAITLLLMILQKREMVFQSPGGFQSFLFHSLCFGLSHFLFLFFHSVPLGYIEHSQSKSTRFTKFNGGWHDRWSQTCLSGSIGSLNSSEPNICSLVIFVLNKDRNLPSPLTPKRCHIK